MTQSAALDRAMSFQDQLRHWRAARRLSQLALAGDAAISARHLAFLETGRARPSRGMALRLAEALELPHTAINDLLQAAGFAPHFPQMTLDNQAMADVRRAMDYMIARHAPYPAVVMDRLWRLVALNRPAQVLFGGFGLGEGASLLAMLAGPAHPSTFIENWPEVAHHLLQRLRMESRRAGGIAELDAAARDLSADPALARLKTTPPDHVVLPTIYRAGSMRLALFSTYAQFGSAEEVALADMKIELMFPADAESERVLAALTPS